MVKHFKNGLRKYLLEEKAVIVLDNAPYYSMKKEKTNDKSEKGRHSGMATVER